MLCLISPPPRTPSIGWLLNGSHLRPEPCPSPYFLIVRLFDTPGNRHTMGLTVPIRQQGHCGACWAFSAIGAIQSTMAIKKYRANVPPTTTHDDDDNKRVGSSSHLGLVRTS